MSPKKKQHTRDPVCQWPAFNFSFNNHFIPSSILHTAQVKTTRWPCFCHTFDHITANTALYQANIATIEPISETVRPSPTMTKAVPRVLVLVLACLVTLSAALPSVLNQVVSAPAQGEPKAPRTLLGKPYRRLRGSQACPPSCWALVTDSNHSGGNAATDADHASAHQAQIANGGWTRTKMKTELRVQFPLPFVLDALNSPESLPARLNDLFSTALARMTHLCPIGHRQTE